MGAVQWYTQKLMNQYFISVTSAGVLNPGLVPNSCVVQKKINNNNNRPVKDGAHNGEEWGTQDEE